MDKKAEILRISKGLGLTHIGSNISVLPILEEIYAKKKPGDIVIVSNAHAHLAHVIVRNSDNIDENKMRVMENVIRLYGIHCDRRAGCDASGGSLGHGLGIGIGYALADKTKTVYVVVSDGSMMEGSNWEALRIIHDLNIGNMEIHCNFNGYTALAEYDSSEIERRMRPFENASRFVFHHTDNGEGFDGIQGHYKKI